MSKGRISLKPSLPPTTPTKYIPQIYRSILKYCFPYHHIVNGLTLRIEVRSLEIILRDVHISCDGSKLQTEHLSPMLKLTVGTLTVDLTRQFSGQNISSCSERSF